MANTTTLADLRMSARRRADMVNSDFVEDDELRDYINDALSELHDILVAAYSDYFKKSGEISLEADTESYELPTDFYKLLDVFVLSGGIRYQLQPFELGELADYGADRVVPSLSGERLMYRLVGDRLFFTPKPTAGDTVEIWYVPQHAKLVEDNDKVSYAVVNGWETFVAVGAAIQCLGKEESDTTRLENEKARIGMRIQAASRNRNAGRPKRIRDVYGGRRNHLSRRVRY